MQDYKKLLVWEKASEFSYLVYSFTSFFPKNEEFGLISQFRRAAISVCANIAEGRGKDSEKDFVRFLSIAKGSLNECGAYITLAHNLGFLTINQKDELQKKCGEVGYLLFRFSQKIKEGIYKIV